MLSFHGELESQTFEKLIVILFHIVTKGFSISKRGEDMSLVLFKGMT